MLHPHLYFVCFAIAGGALGAALLLGGRPADTRGPSVLRSYLTGLVVPFVFGFGVVGIASEALGATRWPHSLYHAIGAGALLAGLSLLAALGSSAASAQRERATPSGEGSAPTIGDAVNERDDAGRDQHE